VAPMVYESGDRSASAIFKWVSLRVPNHIDKVANLKDIDVWANKVGGYAHKHARPLSLRTGRW